MHINAQLRFVLRLGRPGRGQGNYVAMYVMLGQMSTTFSLAIQLLFATPPPSIFSCLYFHGAKPPSFILIRAALELGSDEKTVRAHRLKIEPKFGPPWTYPKMDVFGRFLKNRHGCVFTARRTHKSKSFDGLSSNGRRREVCTSHLC